MHGARKRNPAVQATLRVPVKTKYQLQKEMLREIRGKTKWVDDQLKILHDNLGITMMQKDQDKLEKHLRAIYELELLRKIIPDDVYQEYQILYGKSMFPDIEEPAHDGDMVSTPD